MGLYELITNSNSLATVSINQLFFRGLLALVVILVGVLLGRAISYGLKKLAQKLELSKQIRGSFIDLILVVIRWSIYIVFINIGLSQMGIPALTNVLTSILITIPAFVGALVLLAIGFAIAIYLREVIKDAELAKGKLISETFFYFILIIFGVYSIKTAFISLDEITTRWIISILTVATAFAIIRKKAERPHPEHQ